MTSGDCKPPPLPFFKKNNTYSAALSSSLDVILACFAVTLFDIFKKKKNFFFDQLN
jgi:hypothetical protein